MVPDPETLPAYAKSELGLSTTSMEELCKNEKVKAAVMKAMASAAKTFNLKGFEQVSCFDIFLLFYYIKGLVIVVSYFK